MSIQHLSSELSATLAQSTWLKIRRENVTALAQGQPLILVPRSAVQWLIRLPVPWEAFVYAQEATPTSNNKGNS
ncbi:MAG: hypothetical protein H7A20_00260 [Rhodanobacteraceae bacterium]|nr:hypothetical protein [Rhodanobacteraceae bacterium]